MEHLWCICCGTSVCEYKNRAHNKETTTSSIINDFAGGAGYIILLAVFAFDAKHHALATHLARLRKPGLRGKTTKGERKRKFHLMNSLPPD